MQEVIPELVGLTVTDCGAEHFAGAISGNTGGHDHGVGDHVRTDAHFAERRVGENVRELGVRQGAGAERLHFGIEVGADAGHF